VQALQLTQTAIRKPGLATKDSTLLAILLLDLYEKITNKEPLVEDAWAAHLDGALSLVKLRGNKQFRDPNSLRMLVRFTTNMLISCVATDREVPTDLSNLRYTVSASFLEPSDPKWRESELMISYARLKYQIKRGSMEDNEILATAMKLDAQFKALSDDIIASWQYRVVPVAAMSPHHFETYHHEYPVEHMAQMWNALRLARILLNELVCEYVLRSISNGEIEDSLSPTTSIHYTKQHQASGLRDLCFHSTIHL
jgi:Fungal specific transcription factor domain